MTSLLKITSLIAVALSPVQAQSVYSYQPFAGYLQKMSGCQQCIDAIGNREYSKICTSKTNKKAVYCCNEKPPEPPHSNQRDHQPYFYDQQVDKYLKYGRNSGSSIDSHEYYCGMKSMPDPGADDFNCVNDWQMHLALATCFNDPDESKPGQESTEANCQQPEAENGSRGTKLFNGTVFNYMRDAGFKDGDTTRQKPQEWPTAWAHNETQTILSKQPGMFPPTCVWNIQTDYKKKYLRLQDLYLEFKSLQNINIYITSYFRDDRESNTRWPNEVREIMAQPDKRMIFEMYNNTYIYARPTQTQQNKMELNFWIYQAAEFRYSSKYNIISILISGVGGGILILSVIIYLDGFCALYRYILEQKAERERFAKEDAAQKKSSNLGSQGIVGDGKKGNKKGDQDTQKSIDEYSEDDANFIAAGVGGDDPAVHEGGRQSRPDSNGSERIRKGTVHVMDNY